VVPGICKENAPDAGITLQSTDPLAPPTEEHRLVFAATPAAMATRLEASDRTTAVSRQATPAEALNRFRMESNLDFACLGCMTLSIDSFIATTSAPRHSNAAGSPTGHAFSCTQVFHGYFSLSTVSSTA